MKKTKKRSNILLQSILAVIVVLSGLILVFCSFWLPPQGDISPSVLTALGECFVFGGSLLGISANYKSKLYDIEREYDLRKLKMEEDKDEA